MEPVICKGCGMERTDPNDLMVVFFFSRGLEPYRAACYADLHKRMWFQGYRRVAINHANAWLSVATAGIFLYLVVMSSLFVQFWKGVQEPKWFTVGVALGLPGLGLVGAWYTRWRNCVRFERPLHKRRNGGG